MDLQLDLYQLKAFERLKELLGPKICDALCDPKIEEIILNPDGRLFFSLSEGRLIFIDNVDHSCSNAIIRTAATLCNKELDCKKPALDALLPQSGARFSALIPPVVTAPCFCIRSHHSSKYSLNQLRKLGMLSKLQEQLLVKALKEKQSIIICGATGCGKTTLLNALILEIKNLFPKERVVSIEDTRELDIDLENYVGLTTTEHTGMSELVKYSLRLSPERIVVGEVRGAEALDLIDALSTGHGGSMATLHAGNILQALKRLCLLVSRHQAAPREIESTVVEAVDLIVMLAKHPCRHVTAIAAVEDFIHPNFIYKTLGENNEIISA